MALFVFLVLSVTRCRPPLGQILNHATCDVYLPKAVQKLIHSQCYGYCFLYCVSNIFSFGFIEALDSKGIINTLKRGITSAMECADVAAFTFAMWQIRSRLLCKFISAEATVINLFAILQVFLVVLGKWSKFFDCFIAASSAIRRKIKYLQAKQRTCQNMQGLLHW